MTTRTVTTMWCDNPGCTNSHETRGNELPRGWVRAGEIKVGELKIKNEYGREFCCNKCLEAWITDQLRHLHERIVRYAEEQTRSQLRSLSQATK